MKPVYMFLLGTTIAPHAILDARGLSEKNANPKYRVREFKLIPKSNRRFAQGLSLIA